MPDAWRAIDRATHTHADFRIFQLTAPASLVALPYHSLGHLLTLDDKRTALAHIYSQLRPGGLFIFVGFLMTPGLIRPIGSVSSMSLLG